MWETWVQTLGWEDPLEKGMATHSSILAGRIPWTEQPGGLQSMGSQRIRHNWATNTFTDIHREKSMWRSTQEENHVKTDDEWCISKSRNSKGCLETTRNSEVRKDSPAQVLEGAWPCRHWFQTPSFQKCETINFCFLSYTVSGTLLSCCCCCC